jgi:cytochrome c biogenesis protein CcdA
MEGGMSQRTFSFVAGAVFGLIALGHVLRIVFNLSLVVNDISIPMWASGIAIVIMGYLAYEGFRLARKSPSGV